MYTFMLIQLFIYVPKSIYMIYVLLELYIHYMPSNKLRFNTLNLEIPPLRSLLWHQMSGTFLGKGAE